MILKIMNILLEKFIIKIEKHLFLLRIINLKHLNYIKHKHQILRIKK